MEKIPTLAQAAAKIDQHRIVPFVESVAIMEAAGRVCASSYYAPCSMPCYSQSLYDGYAVGGRCLRTRQGCREYRIVGEIAAGSCGNRKVGAGSAYRIMTGAMVPAGTEKIIPQELCREVKGGVAVPERLLLEAATNIRKKGSEVRRGALLVPRGRRLSPNLLALLAQHGFATLDVYSRPDVAFFCSGSELVASKAQREPGKKISSNRFLLAGLIDEHGGTPCDFGAVQDTKDALENHLLKIEELQPAIIISTGGMGPGRYDLLEESFRRVGGKPFFTALKLRPGKATLCGVLGKSLYFGLPGPPPAVHALFHILIRASLLAAQGYADSKPPRLRAFLGADLHMPKPDMLRLREGVLEERQGLCLVRMPKRKEQANCYMLCPPGKKNMRRGECVRVQPFAMNPGIVSS